jgi:hypothetical protein
MKAFSERLTLGIQARLVILVLATVLPLVGLASFAMIRTVDNERTRIQRDAKERVADLLANVDRQIISIQAELSGARGITGPAERRFRRFRSSDAGSAENPGDVDRPARHQIHQLLSTTRPFGEPLPYYETNSEMLDRVVETGQPQISDLIIGAPCWHGQS